MRFGLTDRRSLTGNRFLDALLGHFAGGGAFFTGCSLVLAGVMLRASAGASAGDGELPARLGTAAGLVGAAVVGFAACPLPRWYFGTAAILFLGWLWLARPTGATDSRVLTSALLAGWTLLGVGWELSWRVGPTLPTAAERELVVVGDSLTAGIGREPETWPDVLARRYDVPVAVRAVPGAKVADPLAEPWWDVPETGGVLLVELGGNDLLARTNPGAFRDDLRTLLGRLERRTVGRGGAVVMLGLPSVPGRPQYGRVQRAVCGELGVPLIPHRVLAGVLFGPDATVDGLHLSPAGHAAMADAVWGWVGPSLP